MSRSSKYFLPLSYANVNHRNEKRAKVNSNANVIPRNSPPTASMRMQLSLSTPRTESVATPAVDDEIILQQLNEIISDGASAPIIPADTADTVMSDGSGSDCIGEIEEDDLIPFDSLHPSRTIATTVTVTTKIKKRKRMTTTGATLQLRSSESSSSSIVIPQSHSHTRPRKRTAIDEIKMMQRMEAQEQHIQKQASMPIRHNVMDNVVQPSKLPPILPMIDWAAIKNAETHGGITVSEPSPAANAVAKVVESDPIPTCSSIVVPSIDLTVEDLDDIRDWKVIDDVNHPLDDESVAILHKSDRYVFSRMTTHQQNLYRQLQLQVEHRIMAAQPMRKYLAPKPPEAVAAEQQKRAAAEAIKEVQLEMMTSSKPLKLGQKKSTASNGGRCNRAAVPTKKTKVIQKKRTTKQAATNRPPSSKKKETTKLAIKSRRVRSAALLSPSPSPPISPTVSAVPRRVRPPQRKAAAAVPFSAPDIEWEELGDTESEEERNDDEYQPVADVAADESDEENETEPATCNVRENHEFAVIQTLDDNTPTSVYAGTIFVAYHTTNSRPPEKWLSQAEALIHEINKRRFSQDDVEFSPEKGPEQLVQQLR